MKAALEEHAGKRYREQGLERKATRFWHLNDRQKVALILGLVVFASLGLYPPWHLPTATRDAQGEGRLYGSIDGGFGWVFRPPRMSASAAVVKALVNDPEFYDLSPADRKNRLTTVSQSFRALPDNEKDIAIQTLEAQWRERFSLNAVRDLVSDTSFYSLLRSDRKARLAAVDPKFRALRDDEQDFAVQVFEIRWSQRGAIDEVFLSQQRARWTLKAQSLGTSGRQLPTDAVSDLHQDPVWVPRIDTTRLALLWVTIATLTGVAILLLARSGFGRSETAPHTHIGRNRRPLDPVSANTSNPGTFWNPQVSSSHTDIGPNRQPQAPVICRASRPGGLSNSRATAEQALRQNLRLKLMYDEAKIDRLIDYERERLPRDTSLETLMRSAIERWERDCR